MAFTASTPTTLANSTAKGFAAAVNTKGIADINTANLDGVKSLGAVPAAATMGKCALRVTANAAIASGESLAVVLRWQNPDDGSIETPTVATLDDTNITAAGTFDMPEVDVGSIPAGAVIALSNTYTAGGGPANPALSLTVQVY